MEIYFLHSMIKKFKMCFCFVCFFKIQNYRWIQTDADGLRKDYENFFGAVHVYRVALKMTSAHRMIPALRPP